MRQGVEGGPHALRVCIVAVDHDGDLAEAADLVAQAAAPVAGDSLHRALHRVAQVVDDRERQ